MSKARGPRLVKVMRYWLPDNGEWCVVVGGHLVHTGSRAECVRRYRRLVSKHGG